MSLSDTPEVTTSVQNLIYSLRRTLIPIVVGFLLAQAARYGFDIPEEQLTGVLEALFMGVYYSAIRLLEAKYPSVGVFLGASSQPSYIKTEKETQA